MKTEWGAPEADFVTIVERGGAFDSRPIDEGAVGAAEIGHPPPAIVLREPRMLPGDERVREHDTTPRAPANQRVVAKEEGGAGRIPDLRARLDDEPRFGRAALFHRERADPRRGERDHPQFPRDRAHELKQEEIEQKNEEYAQE